MPIYPRNYINVTNNDGQYLLYMIPFEVASVYLELPPRCIVLLEDVDIARVGRRDSVDADQENELKSAVALSVLCNSCFCPNGAQRTARKGERNYIGRFTPRRVLKALRIAG